MNARICVEAKKLQKIRKEDKKSPAYERAKGISFIFHTFGPLTTNKAVICQKQNNLPF